MDGMDGREREYQSIYFLLGAKFWGLGGSSSRMNLTDVHFLIGFRLS